MELKITTVRKKRKFRVNDKCGYSTADFKGFYDKRKLCTGLSICSRNVNEIQKNFTMNLDAQYYYVLYNAPTCFDHTSQPPAGSYKFDQCVQCEWQLVIDDTRTHTTHAHACTHTTHAHARTHTHTQQHMHTRTHTHTIKNTMMTAAI
jgi:hypothetical protein